MTKIYMTIDSFVEDNKPPEYFSPAARNIKNFLTEQGIYQAGEREFWALTWVSSFEMARFSSGIKNRESLLSKNFFPLKKISSDQVKKIMNIYWDELEKFPEYIK